MVKEIKYIFIVITPFHKTALTLLFPELIKSGNTLILISDYVKKEGLTGPKESLKKYEFSRSKLFKEPFKYFNKTKKDIANAKRHICGIKEKYNLSNDLEIFIGTDKDIFTQLFLNDIYKNFHVKQLVVIEEGIGFYVQNNLKDHFLSITYKLLTPLFFGARLYYIKRLGAYPKIDIIYLRTPELLKIKNKNIRYIPFNINSKENKHSLIPNGNVLLYSFPDQNYQIEKGLKLEVIKEIASYVKENNRKLIIKPHPRENIKELNLHLSSLDNIEILENNFSGEELDYFNYEMIINFFSSIILDIIERKYPNERVFTIGFTRKPEVYLGKNLKYCSIRNFRANSFINFNNY